MSQKSSLMKTPQYVPAALTSDNLHLFLGAVVALTGLMEVGETLQDDFVNGNFHSGHGVVLIGVWHLFRSLAEIVESFDYFKEGLE